VSAILAELTICFGLRSAVVKSEAQAERRLERNRSATPTASRRRKRVASAATKSRSRRARAKCVPRERKEHGQTERALVGADNIGFLKLLSVIGYWV